MQKQMGTCSEESLWLRSINAMFPDSAIRSVLRMSRGGQGVEGLAKIPNRKR